MSRLQVAQLFLEELTAESEAELEARDIADDPTEYALKQMLNTIGKLIAEHLSLDDLLKLAERVCARDPNNWARRMSPINSAFNGIQARGGGTWIS